MNSHRTPAGTPSTGETEVDDSFCTATVTGCLEYEPRDERSVLTRRRIGANETVTEALLLAIAAIENESAAADGNTDVGTETATNCAAESLADLVRTETLADNVDPDALNCLFGNRIDGTPRTGGRVTFEHGDYWIQIDGERLVTVFE